MHPPTTARRRLTALRVDAGLSQVGLAELAGVASTTVNRIESGATQGHPATLKAIANALGCQVSDLLTIEAAS